jgi:hypothetical protein
MEIEITLPFLALLRCNVAMPFLNDERRIHELVKDYLDGGFEYHEDDQHAAVRRLVETFSWDVWRAPALPKVKPNNGTLEFIGKADSIRALAAAIRAVTKHDVADVPVILRLS